jgi:hypothetical protein
MSRWLANLGLRTWPMRLFRIVARVSMNNSLNETRGLSTNYVIAV